MSPIFFEEKNAGNRMGLRANQIKSLNKKRQKKKKKNKHVFCYQSPTRLLPLLPKRILIKFLVVRFVTGIVTRMITTLERLLSNGLRAPVLIIGLATLGIWLVVPISFALSSYISTAATPRTTYPSSPSRLHASSCAPPASPAWSAGPAAATLGEVGPAPGCPGASASSGRRGSAPCAPVAAPPSARGLEVIVPVIGVVVATAVVVIVVAIVIIVVLIAIVVRGVRVAAPVAASAPASDWRRHVGRGRVVVIVVIPERRTKARR